MREPDEIGVAKAWRVRVTDALREAHVKAFGYADAGLATWVVNGPYHPFWGWGYISLIHLRDIPGAPPAHRQYAGAEYEIMCLSLNPNPEPPRGPVDVDRVEAGDTTGGLPGFLMPADWIVQFHGVSDEQAVEVAQLAIDSIVRGQSCDSDYRAFWESAIKTTVEHYRQGLHA